MIVTVAGIGVSVSPDRFAVPPPRQALPGGGDAAGPEWLAWGGTNAGQRFSTLGQITPANVGDLKIAWTYRTGVRQPGGKSPRQTTPPTVDGTPYDRKSAVLGKRV